MVDVGTILWARNRPGDHGDHLHVEPPTRKTGTPPLRNPGMTDGVRAIFAALEERFGNGEYFLDDNGRYVGNDPGVDWTHMGGWNRRPIAGSDNWSQHAWWNALDIGPYVGQAAQQRFYDFLTGASVPPDQGDDDMIPMWTKDLDEQGWRNLAREGIAAGGEAAVVDYWVRKGAQRTDKEHQDASRAMYPQLLARAARITSGAGAVDPVARAGFASITTKLNKVKEAL